MDLRETALRSIVCLIMQAAKHCSVIEEHGGRRLVQSVPENELSDWLIGEIDQFGKELTKGFDPISREIVCDEISRELKEGSYLKLDCYKEKLLSFIEYIMYQPNKEVMELVWKCIKQVENGRDALPESEDHK
ncbi:hypothetical protein ABEV55_18420 [Aneurinibacillus thermoaerophilus]|uniref:hypothetical protein n=1 Tax=Aneurinibacillus thermoaerophilus TaxID=143495 RepID=UPI002E1B9826|nr:hypothetical protein [Aneurinibacillus thermoaerophilus]